MPASSTTRALPSDALRHVEREGSGVFHFPLLGQFVEDPVVVSWLYEAADRFRNRRGSIVIRGREIRMPESLRQHAIVVRLPAPTIDEYRALLERVVREHTARKPVRADLTNETRSRLLHNLLGLSMVEAEKILTRLIMVDGALSERDIGEIAVAKRQAVEQDGLLEYWESSEGLAGVAGLSGLKQWLAEQSIIAALFEAFARGGRLTTDVLLAERRGTRPLSTTMAERLSALRSWAQAQTVNADGPLPVRAVA